MQKPLLLFLLLLSYRATAQNARADQQAAFALSITRATKPIVVDGDVSDPGWQQAAVATNFWMKWPRDGGPAPEQTEVRCVYDDQYLYVAAVCHDTTPKNVINSLKRDVGYWDSDGFSVVIDPSNTANNGYFFGVNVAGVQMEGLLSVGQDEADLNWDNTWRAEVKTYVDRWTVEYAIPLRILRFKEGQTKWGINFIRNDLGNTMYSVWARVPFQFDGTDLGWTGALNWDVSPKRTKKNINLIPYTSGALSRDYEEQEDWEFKPAIGLDAKIGVGSGMNLDVTINPDFSQVEIDQQVVNLTRFDVQLPEKRTFFLENGDLFGNFGIPPLRPFFSRRIGLDDDGEPLPIIGGLRLSGNLNSDTRLGIMTMQTGRKDSIPSRNNTAIAVNRRVFGRSTLSGYFLNREEFRGGEIQKAGFSRNAGMEFTYISNDGKWVSWLTHHRSMKPGISGKNWWGNMGAAYNTRRLSILLDLVHVAENYYADLGFEQRIENEDILLDTVLRIPYSFVFIEPKYKIFPKKQGGLLNYAQVEMPLFLVLNDNGTVNEFSPELKLVGNFKNSSELSFVLRDNYNNIPVSFSLDDEDDLERCPPILAGQYHYRQFLWEYGSDYRKPLTWSVGGVTGQYLNGTQLTLGGSVSYRFQPFMNIKVEAEYNKLDFPAPVCDLEYLNITPRIEVFFAKNIWWTTFLQYNTQSDNFNINSRLQWRYRPMSDVFLVFTDNYAVKFWGPKNKALVLKVNYWL